MALISSRNQVTAPPNFIKRARPAIRRDRLDLPLGDLGHELELNAKGERMI